MKKALSLTVVALVLCGLFSVLSAQVAPVTTQSLSKMPLAFTKNMGQWDERVLFRTSADGFAAWFTKDKIYYQFTRRVNRADTRTSNVVGLGPGPSDNLMDIVHNPLDRFDRSGDSVVETSLTASLIGANANPQVQGIDLMDYRCNYFLGNDSTKWHTDVSNYSAVVYKDIYPGIDQKFYGNGDGTLEYDFIIMPGADPSAIAVRYDGAEAICIDEASQLVVETDCGKLIERRPNVYQLIGDTRVSMGGEFVLIDGQTIGLKLNSAYRPDLAVVIDPILNYSAYLGGTANDASYAIAVDDSGNAYVTGYTNSGDFPIWDPYQSQHAGGYGDVYVTKINSSGNALIYSTYVGGSTGGSGDDRGYGIAVDRSGDATVSGGTSSIDFPTVHALQTNQGDWDGLVFKLNSLGNDLVYSTYFGGSASDGCYGIALDSSGASYVIGVTNSTDLPKTSTFGQNFVGGINDAFVAKLSSGGDSLLYSVDLGGSGQDNGFAIAVDRNLNVYTAGVTNSPDFPNKGAFQAYQGGYDAFVSKIDIGGDSLIYSTYLGGTGDEASVIAPLISVAALAVDKDLCAYLTGGTYSTNFPVKGSLRSSNAGACDAFVTKFNSQGSDVVYSTYLGGSGWDYGHGISLDSTGCAYVTGTTSSIDFPVEATLNSYQGQYDAFVSRLNRLGNGLVYSTLLGGTNSDGCEFNGGPGAIAVDARGNAFVVGTTSSPDFPASAPFLIIHGMEDAFVSKIKAVNFICGDANGSGTVSISDAVFLINYIFSGGPAPNPVLAGDANCSGAVSISDAVYLINYIFAGGAAPCEACK